MHNLKRVQQINAMFIILIRKVLRPRVAFGYNQKKVDTLKSEEERKKQYFDLVNLEINALLVV